MRDFVEAVCSHHPGDTIEIHSEGGGDLDSILIRIRNKNVAGYGPVDTNVILGEDDARMLFNWLGVWLHARHSSR